MRAAVACLFGTAMTLAGCAVQPSFEARQQQRSELDQSAKSQTEKRTSPAKGTKTCLIKQYTSAYRTARNQSFIGGRPSIHISHSSNIHFRIEHGGAVGVAVSASTYPGLKSHFLIGESRFSAEGDHYADVTPALPALRKDAVIKYAWHNWPYRNEINSEDVFAGFAASYDDCLRFLRTN